jgi:acyl-coenzyme A synthetase/AMP-(fatty) acid ligase
VAVRCALEDGEACGLIVCGEASPDLAARVRAGVGEAVGLALHDVVFAAAARIPRTTSGKIRRPAAAELYARLLEVEAAREAA